MTEITTIRCPACGWVSQQRTHLEELSFYCPNYACLVLIIYEDLSVRMQTNDTNRTAFRMRLKKPNALDTGGD